MSGQVVSLSHHPALKSSPGPPTMTCTSQDVMEGLENPRAGTQNYRIVVMLMWKANVEDNTSKQQLQTQGISLLCPTLRKH